MPYKSLKQERYFNANRDKLEQQGVDVDEWNRASRGMKLPTTAIQKESVIRGKSKMSKHWMQGVSKEIKSSGHKGVFSEAAKRAGKSTREFAEENKHKPGKIGRRARLALAFLSAH
jgi:hypothetical protein